MNMEVYGTAYNAYTGGGPSSIIVHIGPPIGHIGRPMRIKEYGATYSAHGYSPRRIWGLLYVIWVLLHGLKAYSIYKLESGRSA